MPGFFSDFKSLFFTQKNILSHQNSAWNHSKQYFDFLANQGKLEQKTKWLFPIEAFSLSKPEKPAINCQPFLDLFF